SYWASCWWPSWRPSDWSADGSAPSGPLFWRIDLRSPWRQSLGEPRRPGTALQVCHSAFRRRGLRDSRGRFRASGTRCARLLDAVSAVEFPQHLERIKTDRPGDVEVLHHVRPPLAALDAAEPVHPMPKPPGHEGLGQTAGLALTPDQAAKS